MVIKDFEDAGTTVGDVLTIDSSFTTLANETAGASATMITLDVTQNSGAVSLVAVDTDSTSTADIIELNEVQAIAADLTADITNGNSVELFKLLGDGDGTATTLTVAAATDQFYILAYDGGEAFLYFADANGAIADAAATPAEVLPIAHFDSAITLGAFDGSDFIMG